MKLPLCTVATTLAVGVNAIASHSLGVQGHESLSLLNLFRGHPSPVAEHDVGPMLKSAESMLMGLAVNHEDAPLHDLVTQIRPFIAQMQDSINAAHASAQQTLTNFGNDFSGCNSAKATGEAEASALESTKNNQSNQHKSCRTRQKTALDQLEGCQSTLNALQGAKNSSCQLYEDAKLQPGCGGIPPNANEEWESYVSRAATWFTTTNAQFISKKNVCLNDTAKLEAQKTVCLGADGSGGQKKAYFDVKQDCDHLQASLETTTCSYVSKVDATCNSSATCTNTLADSFDAQKTGIETLEHQRKVEWNATERLLCLLDVYGSSGGVDATKLQTCQHIADNTSHLNLVYPTPTPRPSPCADLLPHPCTADYITQEYGGLDSNASTCTACSFAKASSQATKAGDVFRGRWTCSNGDTGLAVHIDTWSTSPTARFEFFPIEEVSQHACEGEFHLTGSWVAASRSLQFSAGSWIKNPCSYGAVGLSGTVSDDGMTYAGDITGDRSCYSFSTTKEV